MFERETAVYQKNLQKWLTSGLVGKFVVIKDSEIVGIFSEGSEAFRLGVERFGAGLFFMSSIMPTDATNFILAGMPSAI